MMSSFVISVWKLIIFCVFMSTTRTEDFVVRYELPDNNPRQTTIGNLISKLQPQFPAGTYQIYIRKCSYLKFNQYFKILNSGEITIIRNFDRDDVNNVCGPLRCCHKSSCEIHLEIYVTIYPKNRRIPVKIVIVVFDENDNDPQFMQKSFSISITENEDTQIPHSLSIALDKDSPDFGIKAYRLSGKNVELFIIKMQDKQPILYAKQPFDFEKPTEKQFNLSLIAEDFGGRNATLELIINVSDVNDNVPMFSDRILNLSIQENTSLPNSLLTLKAIDLDSGDNGKISYYFSSTTLPAVKDAFKLESMTGNLFLTRPLDYELYSERSFDINIMATDHGSPQLSDNCLIKIQVSDINDNSPMIDIAYVEPIPENEQTSEPILKIYVTDEDSIDNEVTCQANRFDKTLKMTQMGKDSYFFYSSGIYDYEKQKNLSLSIICKDSGPNPRITNQLLIVPIKDSNDNTPRFLKSIYRISIVEDWPKYKTFIKVQATDEDSDDFGKVVYSIGLKNQKYFTIDSLSGEVQLNNHVDRELRDIFNISVIATDGGGLKAFSYIKVNVIDVNDNYPILESGPNMSVSENFPIGSKVGFISVIDHDLGDNGKVEWTFDLIGNSSSMLRIDNHTILTSAVIDRESVAFLYILITMVDMGYPRLTASTTVTILIIDENDNIPRIIYPTKGTFIEENEISFIAVNSPQYSSVVSIKSHDPDHGINGDVLYHVLPSNGSRFFIINETSGLLQTNWVYDTISFTPTHPKEDVYMIAFTAYNQVKSSKNQSSSTSSFFYVKVGPYHHFINSEVFYKYHRRPFFNNIVLLILIGGFTISLSAALIAAIIWAKSKYSTESTSLEQAQANDGKFVMMMMSGEQQNTNNTYVYDPYSSLIVDADRTIDSGYALSHSRSSTFNSRHNNRDHGLINSFEPKTMPRSVVQSSMMHQYPSDADIQGNSLSTADLVNCSASASVRHHKPGNTFYRHFEHDQQCVSPMINNKPNRHRSFDQQYGSVSPRIASICDPTPAIVTSSHWVPKDMAPDNASNSYTVC